MLCWLNSESEIENQVKGKLARDVGNKQEQKSAYHDPLNCFAGHFHIRK